MPRLATQQYLYRRAWIRHLWVMGSRLFGDLSSEQQMALHHFFRPASVLTATGAIEHRRIAGQRYPTLPARAGRAYHQIIRRYQSFAVLPRQSQEPVKHRKLRTDDIRVRAVRRPEPDLKRLSRAFLMLGLYLANEEAAAKRRQP